MGDTKWMTEKEKEEMMRAIKNNPGFNSEYYFGR
jgi:hypothetical protein